MGRDEVLDAAATFVRGDVMKELGVSDAQPKQLLAKNVLPKPSRTTQGTEYWPKREIERLVEPVKTMLEDREP